MLDSDRSGRQADGLLLLPVNYAYSDDCEAWTLSFTELPLIVLA